MSKKELDEIEAKSKKSGTVTGSIRMRKEKLVEIQAKNRESGTGSSSTVDYTRKVVPFDRYEIVVKLTSDGKFAGIEEVRINKDFRNYSQRVHQRAFEYVDSYPQE